MQNYLELCIDLNIIPFLSFEDCCSLEKINKKMYEMFQDELWHEFLQEHYNVLSEFKVEKSNVVEWRTKRVSSIQKKIFGVELVGKKNIIIFSKKKRKQYNSYWGKLISFFIPRYQIEYCKTVQIFRNRKNKLSKWNGYYYEIYFPFSISYESVQIGFVNSDTDREQYNFLLGWSKSTIGYHTDDRKIYYSYDGTLKMKPIQEEKFGNKFSKIYVLGAGYDSNRNIFFFTQNCDIIFEVKNEFSNVQSFSPICCGEMGTKYDFNDGKKIFSTYSFLV